MSKVYGSKQALNSVSFAIERAEIFGLLGPNGAGKTSLISILTSLEQPSSGQAYIFAKDVRENNKHIKTQIGVVPQELVNHGFFTVREVLEFQSGYFGLKNNKARIDDLLERLKLADVQRKRILQLSGGMRRRFMIAKALVHEPKILLLDEPTAGVDLELRLSLWDFVTDLNRKGLTILLTTHYLEEAQTLCDRIAILNRGELKCLGKTKDIISSLTTRKIRILLKGPIPDFEHPYLRKILGQTLEFHIPAQMEFGSLLAQIPCRLENLADIQMEEGNLEEAMIQILKS
ncbi:MAG: ABC transporter ATP-binding protein [Oligoflexales bacterium]|nr:ABC transporter ATP-binding protein [Oligoflexales bacterium]